MSQIHTQEQQFLTTPTMQNPCTLFENTAYWEPRIMCDILCDALQLFAEIDKNVILECVSFEWPQMDTFKKNSKIQKCQTCRAMVVCIAL